MSRPAYITRHAGDSSRVLTAIAVVARLVAGAWVRVAGNDARLLWFDEINTALLYSGHDLDREAGQLSGRELEPRQLRALMRLDSHSDVRSAIDVVIKHDPQLSPLYFVALRSWARIVGDSIGELRSLSAVADLLSLPLLFWVCMELSGSTRAGWIAIVLAAISPFHVVYSQELRQYTFWMLLIVSSCAVLLWALRTRGLWKWSLYALTVAAGLYTHVLFGFVVLSHAAYVFASWLHDRSDPRGQDGRDLTRYVGATACGIALFGPWIWVMWTHSPSQVSWWNKSLGHFNMDVAHIVNSEARPLLISDDASQLLSLSHSLDDRARVLLLHGSARMGIPDGYSGVYVLSPSAELKREFATVHGVKLDAVFPRGELYKFVAQ